MRRVEYRVAALCVRTLTRCLPQYHTDTVSAALTIQCDRLAKVAPLRTTWPPCAPSDTALQQCSTCRRGPGVSGNSSSGPAAAQVQHLALGTHAAQIAEPA